MYTKTFGGKIWTNLNRVSPDNIFDKNFKRVQFEIFRQSLYEQHLVQFFFRFQIISLLILDKFL